MTDENPPAVEAVAPATADIPVMYVNSVGIRGGAFDVMLDLGFAVPPAGPDEAAVTQWLARVSMSWEHAATLMRFLDGAIKQYEEQVGQLPDIEKVRVQP